MKLYRRQSVTPAQYALEIAATQASLSSAQQGALYHYTEVGYGPLNEKLNFDAELTAADEQMVGLLDEVCAASDSRARTLYRGAKRIYGPVVEGEVCPFPAFTSATSDPQQVFNFITPERPIVFEIETAAGCPISLHRGEFEYLLPRHQKYFVQKITDGVQWHAEFGESGYTRSIDNATVIQMVEV